MTDEQIKQNADAYANNYAVKSLYRPAYDGFVAGAHSRDEEIEHYRRIAMTYKIDAQDTAAECERLHDIIDELRNPWISVEERLPKEGKCVFVRYGDVTHSLYSSAYMIEKDLWSIEGYGNGEVTHWMSISQIEKEEVQ